MATNKELEKQVGELVDNMGVLAKAVQGIVNKQNEPTPTPEKVQKENKEQEKITEAGPDEHKIHPTHKAIIKEVLGEDFEAWETYSETATTHFLFNILVPEQFSPLAKGQLDIRSKAISMAEGENGVRQWAILVRKNLARKASEQGTVSPFEKPLN